ncbi:MAG: hypothetical protein R3F59_02670 [Myxococcota bacterium]
MGEPSAEVVAADEVVPPLTAVAVSGDLPPPWVEAALQVGDSVVLAVGRSGPRADPPRRWSRPGSTPPACSLRGLAEGLQAAPAWPVVEPSLSPPLSPEQAARAAARLEAHLRAAGGAISRERTWTRDAGGGAVDVAARYTVDRAAWDALLASYAEAAAFRTIRVGLLFPTVAARLPGDGELVVVGVDDGERSARPGDVVLAVGGQPVRTVAQFAASADQAWRQQRAVAVEVASNGLPVTLTFGHREAKAAAPVSLPQRPLSSPR